MYIYYESIVLQTCLFGPTVFPTCFPVCDMFHTCEMTGCDGKTFQLNLEIVWHHVDALCCSWNAMEPGWANACPDKWVSHFGDWRRRGFQNIVWLVCWVGWNPVKLQQPASARSVEFGELWPRILLSGDFRPRILMSHRTRGVSSHHRGPHRTPHTYSQIIVLHKRDRTPEKLAQTAKNIFPSSEVKCSGIWSYGIWGKLLFFQRFEQSRIQSHSMKFWYFWPVEAMEILDCCLSRAR